MENRSSGKNTAAYVMFVLSLLIFGTNGLLVARISLASSQIVLLRTVIGGLVLTALVLLRGGFQRENLRREWRWLLPGGVMLGLNWVALFEAYRQLNVSLATLIYYVGPILLLLASPLLLREKLTGRKIAACVIVAAGLILISGSIALKGTAPSSLLVAAASALFYAALIYFNKRIVLTSGLQTAALELDVAACVTLVYTLATAGPPRPTAGDIPYIALICLVNTGLAYLLYFSGLQKLSGQSAALISYLDPVSALFFSALVLHETMTPVQVLGAVLIIGGAMFGELRRRKT